MPSHRTSQVKHRIYTRHLLGFFSMWDSSPRSICRFYTIGALVVGWSSSATLPADHLERGTHAARRPGKSHRRFVESLSSRYGGLRSSRSSGSTSTSR